MLLTKQRAKQPTDDGATKPSYEKIQALNKKAIEKFKSENYKDAIEIFKEVLNFWKAAYENNTREDAAKSSISVLYNLGSAEMKLNNFKDAEGYLIQAIEVCNKIDMPSKDKEKYSKKLEECKNAQNKNIVTIELELNRAEFQVPPRNKSFSGRELELKQIESHFKTDNLLCLIGSEGLGKTELAAEYIHQATYTQIIWLNAEPNNLIPQIQIYMEKRYGIQPGTLKEPDLIKKFYQSFKTKSCLVFDNVDNEASIKNYLPDDKDIDVLITSQSTDWSLPALALKCFTIQETSTYLQKSLGILPLESELEKLIQVLGGLPLGLAQAASYIKQNNLTILEYCNLFEKERLMLLEQGVPELRNIATALSLTLSALKQKDQLIMPIVSIVAYLSADLITEPLLESYCQQNIHNTIELLIDCSILFRTGKTLRIQRLTQAAIQLIHEKNGLIEKQYSEVVEWLLPQLDYKKTEVKDIKRAIELIPHAVQILNLNKKLEPLQCIKLLEKLTHLLHEAGNAKIMLQYCKKLLTIKEEYYGLDHPEVGVSLMNLGIAHSDLGEYKQKEALLIQALAIAEKHYGPDHFQTAITLDSLGTAYGSLGNYEQQKMLLTRALAIKEKHYGPDHFQTAITLGNLGTAYGTLGDYEQQKTLLTRALTIIEKDYGPEHPQTGMILDGLGTAYGALGNYAQQKTILIRALTIQEENYGLEHPEVGKTLINLSNAYGSLGDYKKQKELLTRALTIKEKYYGLDHPETAIALGNLGTVYGALGDFEQQKILLTQALAIKEKYYGLDHPEAASILENLGTAYGSLGDFEQQKILLTQALAIKEKHYGPQHPETAITLGNLGIAYGDLGNYEQRKELLARALVIKERYYGPDHPQTGMALTNLGTACGTLRDYEQQKALLTRALTIAEKHYGPDHPRTGIVLESLGSAYGGLRNYEQQKILLSQALTITEKNYGSNHPNTGLTLAKLGGVYFNLKDIHKACEVEERAYAILLSFYGAEHKYTKNCLSLLQEFRKGAQPTIPLIFSNNSNSNMQQPFNEEEGAKCKIM